MHRIYNASGENVTGIQAYYIISVYIVGNVLVGFMLPPSLV
jgi:hypothetical protein